MQLVSVAALDDNRLIGDEDDELPWPSIPADKQQYRERIADDPVILGRVTFESMLEDLPGSHQVVLSRNSRSFAVETAHRASSVDDAMAVAEQLDAEQAYVIGGGVIYELFQPHVDRMVLSRVHGTYDGDTYYPEWDPDAWELVETTDYERFRLEEWVRVSEKTNVDEQ